MEDDGDNSDNDAEHEALSTPGARREVSLENGAWRVLTPDDFKPVNVEIKSVEDYMNWFRVVVESIDPYMNIKVKDSYGDSKRLQVYCACSGEYKSKDNVKERLRTSQKCGCPCRLYIRVSRSGELLSNITEQQLEHCKHENKFKSKKVSDNLVPIELVVPKISDIEIMLTGLDISQMPSFSNFLIAVQVGLFEGKRLDRASRYFIKDAYARRVNKDYRPSTPLEMIHELEAQPDKYYVRTLRDSYDQNKVLLLSSVSPYTTYFTNNLPYFHSLRHYIVKHDVKSYNETHCHTTLLLYLSY
jgi:hypothetical protein